MRRSRTNTQPFYHRVTVLFTATQEMNHSEIEERIKLALNRPVLKDTVVVEEVDVEAGNPQDLMS